MKTLIKLGLISLLATSQQALSQPLSAADIIRQSNLASYYAANDGRAEARMRIVDANGNQQLRQFTILRKDVADEGQQKMLVVFSRPTDVKGTVFRVEKHIEQDDYRWLYLPALDLVKRISAGDKRTSFVGSHFFYEDVSGRNPHEDKFVLLETTSDSFVIKGTPKDPSSVEFAYYQATIDKASFLPMAVVYFDDKGKAQRKMTVLKTRDVQGHTTVVHSRIEQLIDGSYTEMQFRNVAYDLGFEDSVFSERSLRNPPGKWLN